VHHCLNDQYSLTRLHSFIQVVQYEGSIFVRPVLEDILQDIAITTGKKNNSNGGKGKIKQLTQIEEGYP
jgi:hypothetical protein